MSLKYIAVAFSLALVTAEPALCEVLLPSALAKLSAADLAEFRRIEKTISQSNGDDDKAGEIRQDIERFLARHPDFVPIEVEAARLEWKRISGGMGKLLGGQSLLPVFLEYEKMAPDYGKTYRLAAAAYLDTHDYAGATISLEKAAELEPDEPRVDILRSRLSERKRATDEAVRAARTALSKSSGDTEATVDAVMQIANNHGIATTDDVDKLARAVIAQAKDRSALLEIGTGLIDRYHFHNALIPVVAAVLGEAAKGPGEPSAVVKLQWARMNLIGGTLYFAGPIRHIDPAYAAVAKEILAGLQNVPAVAERVWDNQFAIAMSANDLAEAERLIALGERNGFSPTRIGVYKAIVHYARDELREALVLYDQLKLPKDGVYWMAMERIGNRDLVKQHRWQIVEDNPTDPYALGDYANFMLYHFKDTAAAIEYSQQAIAILPHPLAQQTLSTAYLLASGTALRAGRLDDALALFEKAKEVGFNETFLMQNCWDFCGEVQAPLRAFR